jgi:glucose/arabinose dehydrogenase
VWLVDDGGTRAFLDLSAVVGTEGGAERGLLGLAFHPEYAANGRLFVVYTDLEGDSVIAEHRVTSDPDLASPDGSAVLTLDQPERNHNGGMLEFGPDGYLYASFGDGGGSGDPNDLAEDPANLYGSVIRIDVDGAPPYVIPPDNPFADGVGGAPEVWHYGLRNPWRFSFDPADGMMWIADVGQGYREEINVVAGDAGGLDFAWNTLEGTRCFDPPTGCSAPGTVPPLHEFGHTAGRCSVIGGYVYRGPGMPEIDGKYVYGDFCDGRVRTLQRDGGSATAHRIWVSVPDGLLTSFGRNSVGELYVATTAGTLYRIDPLR